MRKALRHARFLYRLELCFSRCKKLVQENTIAPESMTRASSCPCLQVPMCWPLATTNKYCLFTQSLALCDSLLLVGNDPWTCNTNGSPTHTSTGVALGGSGVLERSRSSEYKLEEHSQQGLVKDGNHLGGSGGGSSEQIRMASKCGPMHVLGCRLYQG